MPTFTMLIGVPGSGKSTWLAQQPIDWTNTVIVSSDNIIERRAQEQGKTYSEVFHQEVKSATAEMNQILRDALAKGLNIINDQTNTTVKSRKSKLAAFPANYRKVAVYFRTPDDEEHQRRLNSRPGKTIPPAILNSMKSQLEEPQADEGWDEILFVG